jgi:hypothetical protein
MAHFLHLPSPEEIPEEDPLSGIANLFDVSVVFIVGLMMTLFSVYRIGDLMDAKSEVTMVKTNAQGEREIIVKKGTQITAYKVSGKTATGDGERLGTAYRLANGQIIYVPRVRMRRLASVAILVALALTMGAQLRTGIRDQGSEIRELRTRPIPDPRSLIPRNPSASPTSSPTAISPAPSRPSRRCCKSGRICAARSSSHSSRSRYWATSRSMN